MTHEFFAYQIVILVSAFLLAFRVFVLMLKGKKEVREFILALLIWSSFAILAVFPNLSQELADIFGFVLGINFLLTISIIILFMSVIQLIVKTDKNNSTTTQLVRQIALEELKKK